MRIIDLTHLITEDMPVYPGTEPPKLQEANTYARDGFKETKLEMFSHTGTHMDAPAHLFYGHATLDALPIEQFIGSAVVIDCTGFKEGERISLKHVLKTQPLASSADFLLFYTGWDRFWGTDAYFGDYPTVTEDVIDFVVKSGKKGIGFDVIGLDAIGDGELPLHKRLLSQGKFLIIENLRNLGRIGDGLFTLYALPLNYINADGAPTRVVAVCHEEESL